MLEIALLSTALICYVDSFYTRFPYFRFSLLLLYPAVLFLQPKNASFIQTVHLLLVFLQNHSAFSDIDHSFFYGCIFILLFIWSAKKYSFWALGLICHHPRALTTIMVILVTHPDLDPELVVPLIRPLLNLLVVFILILFQIEVEFMDYLCHFKFLEHLQVILIKFSILLRTSSSVF